MKFSCAIVSAFIVALTASASTGPVAPISSGASSSLSESAPIQTSGGVVNIHLGNGGSNNQRDLVGLHLDLLNNKIKCASDAAKETSVVGEVRKPVGTGCERSKDCEKQPKGYYKYCPGGHPFDAV